MEDGIKKIVFTALDTKDALCLKMMEEGMPAEMAIKASNIASKENVQSIIDACAEKNSNRPGRSASQITHDLKQIGQA